MNAEEVVVGDIIYVALGDRIPADIRILEAKGFKVLDLDLVANTLHNSAFFCLGSLHYPFSVYIRLEIFRIYINRKRMRGGYLLLYACKGNPESGIHEKRGLESEIYS